MLLGGERLRVGGEELRHRAAAVLAGGLEQPLQELAARTRCDPGEVELRERRMQIGVRRQRCDERALGGRKLHGDGWRCRPGRRASGRGLVLAQRFVQRGRRDLELARQLPDVRRALDRIGERAQVGRQAAGGVRRRPGGTVPGGVLQRPLDQVIEEWDGAVDTGAERGNSRLGEKGVGVLAEREERRAHADPLGEQDGEGALGRRLARRVAVEQEHDLLGVTARRCAWFWVSAHSAGYTTSCNPARCSASRSK